MKKIGVIFLLFYFTSSFSQSWFRTYTKGAVIYDVCNFNNSYFGFGGIGIGSAFSNYLLRVNSNGDTLFTKSFNDVSDSSIGHLYRGFVDFNKDLIMVGYTAYVSATNNLELKLIKTDTLGNLKWIRTFVNNPNGVHISLIQTFDSCYAIFGNSNQKGFMYKTDRDGNLLINKDYGYNYTYIKSVVQNADSGFTFCGFDNINFGANFRSFICKTKANGDTLWTKYFYDSNRYFFHSLSHESSGGYFVGVTDTLTLYLLKLSPLGNVIWKSSIDKKGYIYSVGEDYDHNIFCSGNNQTSSTDSVYFAKFNPNGYKIFDKSWASGGSEAYKSIQCSDSAYVICGVYADSSLVIRLDSTSDFVTNTTKYSFNEIQIYPNPTNSILEIIDKQNQFQNSNIEIRNQLGQLVYTSSFIQQINITHLSKGMYFLIVKDKSDKWVRKIVKE